MRFRQRTELSARRAIRLEACRWSRSPRSRPWVSRATTSSAKPGGDGAKASVEITELREVRRRQRRARPTRSSRRSRSAGSTTRAARSSSPARRRPTAPRPRSSGSTSTRAASAAIPLKLVKCYVKNAEAEGLEVRPEVPQRQEHQRRSPTAALAVGANTINSTVAGKKPIIETIGDRPLGRPRRRTTIVLFTARAVRRLPVGQRSPRRSSRRRRVAIVYPTQPGQADRRPGRSGTRP